ncbi:MAG: recombinase family protein [Bacillaceae bacterium]
MSKTKKSIEERLQEAKKVATYKRVSQEQQEYARQNDVIQQYLKHTLDDVETIDFEDKISATKKSFTQRHELGELLEEAQEKNIDAIIVSDVDRLSRQPKEHAALRKLFQQLDIPVIIASKNKLYTSDDIINNMVEVGLSKLETDNMSVRIRSALKEKMKSGKWRGGRVPFGFRLETEDGESNLVAVDSELKIVKQIFEWYSTSGTFNSIAKKLNETDGDCSPIDKETTKWTANKVKYIVTNPIYMGELTFHRFPAAGGYTFKERNEWQEVKGAAILRNPPINKELWERCWHKYNKVKMKAPKYTNTSFYFKGLLKCRCSICNGELFHTKDQRSKGRGSRWYISSCKKKVRADLLDEEFHKYWSGLQEKSNQLFQEEVRLLLREELNSLVNDKENKEIIHAEKKTLLDKVQDEIDAVTKEYEISTKEFIESNNEVVIALMVTHQLLENQLNQVEKELKIIEFLIRKLKEAIQVQQGTSFNTKLIPKSFNELSHADKRSLVLMTVKECSHILDEEGQNKIEFIFRFPFKNYFQN